MYRMSRRRKLSKRCETAQEKLDGPVIGKKTLSIEGMHCAHCAGNVTKMLNQIDGVSARVDLEEPGGGFLRQDRIRRGAERSGGEDRVSCDRDIIKFRFAGMT